MPVLLNPAVHAILAGVLYAGFGTFVFRKLKGRANKWPYTLWIILSVVWFFSAAGLYLHLGLQTAEFCGKISYTAIAFIPIMMLHFCAAFLENHSTKRWILYGYMLAALFAATVWIDGVFLNGCYLRSWGYFPRASWMHAIFVATVVAQTNYFFLQITQKLKDPAISPTKREQVRYIRRGILWYAASSHDFLINYGVHSFPLAPILSVIGLGHFAYAIVRHHLLDIQLIIRRTLMYSVASTILTTLYVGILFVTVELLRPLVGGRSWASVIITCCVAAFCHPLIRRVQRPIDQLLGRSRLDHGVELMKFSTELGQDQSIERARSLLMHLIEEAFRPTGFVIYRRSTKGYELFTQKGSPLAPEFLSAESSWVKRFEDNARVRGTFETVLSSEPFTEQGFVVGAAAPLLNQRRLQGFMLLGEKRSEESYTEQDLILLRIVANQAAVALERPYLIKEVGSGFAHEIKTPLANIAMPAELCVLDLQDLLEKDYKDIHQFLPVLVKRLEYIVDQALFASNRVDAMQQLSEATSAARRTTVALRDLAERAAQLLAEMAQRGDVQLAVEIPETLTVIGDKQQLEILVGNLMKNAIEAVTSSVERQVTIRARQKSDYVVIDVEDSGPGIQRENQERIFEPHFSTKTGNTRGMGLYIARRIAYAHEAALLYERRHHRTVMRVTFPLAKPAAETNSLVEQTL